jgi:hypothetical protein
MPNGMKYSEEGIYDYTPIRGESGYVHQRAQACRVPVTFALIVRLPQIQGAGLWRDPAGGKARFVRPLGACFAGLAVGIAKRASAARTGASTEPIVHDSDMRKAFIQGRVLDDADRGQKCER